MEVVHLNVHSGYSLLESAVHLERLVQKVKQLDMQAIALTDKNVMYGSLTFYRLCLQQGIKPIIGLELSFRSADERIYPLILLAKNIQGYQHLIQLTSLLQTNENTCVVEGELAQYNEGLIAIMPYQGEISELLHMEQESLAVQRVQHYKQIFHDDFYLSMSPVDVKLNERVKRLAGAAAVEYIALSPVNYIESDDALAYQCVLAIKHGLKIDDQQLQQYIEKGSYVKSKTEMEQLYRDYLEAVETTKKIADKCSVELELGKRLMPKFPTPEGYSADEWLQRLSEKGLAKRYMDVTEEARNRLAHELNIIKKMGFSDYFLIVWDFMKYAHNQGILTGPGRGSAAGSIVAYVLGITNVDPLKYDLLFERFLNPERVSMPDIDIDFPDNRRDEIIKYVADKYGREHVAQIITFGTLAARASLRDTARAIGVSSAEVDRLAKSIPAKPGMTLNQALQSSKRVQEQLERSAEIKRLFQIAIKLEGLPRHTSTHAAGLVIGDESLSKHIPVQAGQQGMLLTQYPMEDVEAAGLLKMDFLGLRNLTLIETIQRLIRSNKGRGISVRDVPLDDAKTFKLLSNGDTTGVFQLESEGMRSVLQRLKPTQFEDIIAVNALYRPGPMEQIPDFIARKHGTKKVEYLHPVLKPILENTYGIIVYQEQIIQIASQMAGFTLGEADILRRAVSKKKLEALNEQRASFVKGCLSNGYKEETAHQLYDFIVQFANYGFNRSHAVAYSMIAYQLAYLKANYPLYFMAALLSSVIGNEEKTGAYLAQAKLKKLDILPPSINKSSAGFRVEGEAIRCSLAIIKGIGVSAVQEIVQARKKKPFEDLFDFCARVSLRIINRKVIESLIFAGCFDEFKQERAVLLASLDAAFDYVELASEEDGGFFLDEEVVPKPDYTDVEPFERSKELGYEKEVLGFYLSAHPVQEYRQLFDRLATTPIHQLASLRDKTAVKLGVYLLRVKAIQTKKGDQMAFVSLTDETGEIDGVVFPDVYQQYALFLTPEKTFVVDGYLEQRNGRLQVNIKKFTPATRLEGLLAQTLYLKVDEEHHSSQVFQQISTILHQSPGPVEIVLYYEKEKKATKLSSSFHTYPTEACLMKLRQLLGEQNVVLTNH